ncbi:MAG TPA: amino acid adenylation domain-containing protein, partial [Thermoanaerobaculia bacterium]|nr:amino acid adenylation domain-containing protein [Thermoanaerobaculia bacterium]
MNVDLSYGQRGLWVLSRLAPESSAYHIAAAARLSPAFDMAALRRALRALGERHPILRATFHEVAGEPVQRIGGVEQLELSEICATSLSEGEREERLGAEACRPFALATELPVHAVVLHCSPDEDRLLLVLHHLVADFWTLALLARELSALYQAEHAGGEVALRRPGLSYADYVGQQRELVLGAEGEKLWEYWRQQLAGPLPVLNLPTDRPRPAVQTYAGSSVSLRLSRERTQGVSGFVRRQRTTLFTVLLTAFSAWLHRYTGQRDLVLGTPAAGRRRKELAATAGYFVNPLVIRVGLPDETSFGGLLERVQETALAAFDHQDFPFALLAERLEPQRDPGRSPLFQHTFQLYKARRPEERALTALALGEEGAQMGFGGHLLESLPWRERSAQFDLSLRAGEVGDTLVASLQYNSDLYDRTTAERMVRHFERLLGSSLADPTRPLSRLALLTEAEEHQLLSEWNGLPAPCRIDEICLHELIFAQAGRIPEAVALVGGEERLTYRELGSLAHRLAGRLRTLGVGPEVRVAVCLERRPALAVSLLAVLAAGGAYVPLDPGYPLARQELMLTDAGAAVLITRGPLVSGLELDGIAVVDLDEGWGSGPGGADVVAAGPGNLAYIMYTSGSTGRPKGVAIEHRSILALAQWAREVFSVEELTGVLAATSVCFDLSVFELFVPLALGGRVILAENALALPELPAAHEVRLVNTVPSAAAELVRSAGLPASVRTVNLAGEALPGELVARLYETGKVERVFNLYGPSEDTTYSTWALQPRVPGRRPSIGRPVRGSEAYLLDPAGETVPIGVAGELALGGAGLARGYLGRPDRTAERFVPDPFSGRPGARMYRTGDLARFLSTGELEFLGRIDHQVKVRGFRIELGEVEAALRGLPGIAAAAVVVHGAEGEKRLVAFIAGKRGERTPEVGTLRALLAERLPQPMVPGLYVALPELPSTTNGKLDRRALERLASGATPTSTGAFREAQGPIAELIAGVWCEVLGRERVGADED